MFASQLILFVAVLLVLEDAQAQQSASLTSANAPWNSKTLSALNLIRYAGMWLKDVHHRLRKSLLDKADKLIGAILSEKNRTEILDRLTKALLEACKAFAVVNEGCTKVSTNEERACRKACALIKQSTLDLMDAIIEVRKYELKNVKNQEP